MHFVAWLNKDNIFKKIMEEPNIRINMMVGNGMK